MVTRTEIVEVEVPVTRKVPEERLRAHEVPMLPECPPSVPDDRCVQVKQALETLGACYEELHKANGDKMWIWLFQKFDGTPLIF